MIEEIMPVEYSKLKGVFVGFGIACLFLGFALLLSLFIIGIPLLFFAPFMFIVAPLLGLGFAKSKCPNCGFRVYRLIGFQPGVNCQKCKRRVMFTERGLKLA